MPSSSSTEHKIQKTGGPLHKGDVSLRARKTLEIVKRMSPTLLASRVNYKKCKDGVAVLEALRSRVEPASGPISYSTLVGQQMAPLLSAASLDNVLSVLIDETANGQWRCDVILDFTIMGSPEGESCATRHEAEQVALGVLSHLGAEFVPAEGYEPVDEANLVRAMTNVSHETGGPDTDPGRDQHAQWERSAEKVLCNLVSKLGSRSDVTQAEIAALRYELAYLRERLGCSSDQSFPERDNALQADDLSLIFRIRTLTEEEQSTLKILIASHLVCLDHLRAAGETPRLPRRVSWLSDDGQRQGAGLRIYDHDLTNAEISDIWELNRESELATFDQERPVAPTIH
jgi:hypothetical protein